MYYSDYPLGDRFETSSWSFSSTNGHNTSQLRHHISRLLLQVHARRALTKRFPYEHGEILRVRDKYNRDLTTTITRVSLVHISKPWRQRQTIWTNSI